MAQSLAPAGPAEEIRSVQILAPLTGRDVLAIGKNYKAHAKLVLLFRTNVYAETVTDSANTENFRPRALILVTRRNSLHTQVGCEQSLKSSF